MDKDFLSYYNSELTFIDHNAEQFAKNNPKIAAQLQISSNARKDPHVERLIQSVAFLNARMRYKLDDNMADTASAILSVLMPNLLAPIPSLSIVQFNVDATVDKIQAIEQHRELEFLSTDRPSCIFRTAYDTEVLPVEVKSAKLVAAASKDNSLNEEDAIESLLNIKLITTNPAATFSKIAPKKLRFFISANESHAYALYDLIMKGTVKITLASSDTDPEAVQLQPDKHIRQVGFALDEGLFPYKKNAFAGYRLLTELFVFPRKFLFFDIVGITPKMLAHVKNELQLFFYLKDSNKDIENFVTKNCFALNCTPVVNLFTKTMEPINNDWREPEYRIIPDANDETFYDIYDIQSVTAVFDDGQQMQLDPFYAVKHVTANNEDAIFWSTRRVSSSLASSQKMTGNEVFISFSDVSMNTLIKRDHLVARIEATVSNGHAPSLAPFGDGQPEIQFYTKRAQVSEINCLVQPTPTYYGMQRSERMWNLISLLVLNYMSLVDVEEGCSALKQILSNFDYIKDGNTTNMINGISSVSSEQGLSRDPSAQLNAFCKGLIVTVEFDEAKFIGNSLFLFSSVLENFLSMYATVNSFIKLRAVSSGKRKVIHEWKPRSGTIALL